MMPVYRRLFMFQNGKIIIKRENSVLENKNEWNEYIDWSIDKLEKFHKIFGSRLRNL